MAALNAIGDNLPSVHRIQPLRRRHFSFVDLKGDLRVNFVFMTAKRKLFWGVTTFVFGIDVAIHFYSELQKILTVANEPPGWPHSFSWIAYALMALAWNTFARTAETIESPLGIIALAVVAWGYFVTKPLPPKKC
jgi:hypothetical protein